MQNSFSDVNIKRVIGVLIILLVILGDVVIAQTKKSETREQTWFGYFNQTRFTKRSGIWVDLHLRLTSNFVEQANLNILRFGYVYYLSDQVRVTAGYAYVTQYGLADGEPDVPEHRPWQQIQWMEKKNGFNMMQWFRIDERFRTKVIDDKLTDSYTFNWRFRYNIALTFPLKGKVIQAKTPFFFFNDELHINAGKNIIYNYFDQNRLFVGLGYQFTSHLNAQLGYMYVFQQLPEGNKYANINAIRLFVFHNLDLRKSNL
jgi:long-subunit fatty acid transport protein